MGDGPFTGLVLAASRGNLDPLAQAGGVSHKCFIDIAGQPMLRRVVSAVMASGRIGRTIVAIEPESIAELWTFFPDPWRKTKHHKRRLVQADFAALLVRKLAPGGRLHLATDWHDYAEQMWDVLDATPGLRNRAGPRGSVPRPEWRPQTHFETRGQKLGHGVWDLLYDKTPDA